MGPVMLFATAVAVPLTFTDIVHDVLAARLPPLRLTEVALAVAVNVPPQLLLALGLLLTAMPAGNASVNEIPL